jgi:hypothetical protein|tara:strand:+ start:161 stop:298 length:138 start_codon:yes stop_codon:yes gene_type:complete
MVSVFYHEFRKKYESILKVGISFEEFEKISKIVLALESGSKEKSA